MNFVPKINRRTFVIGSAAAGGLALGIDLPFGPKNALAAPGDRAQFQREPQARTSFGIWVAVKPDDIVAIRVVRAEMGQGSQTGLAQLIAEELDADWSKVTIEYPTPADNVKRKRAWGKLQLQRQPRDPRIEPVCARRRSGGAPDADSGRSRRMEGACRRMYDGQGRHLAQGVRPRPRPTARWRKLPLSWRCRRSPSSRTRRIGRSPASR